MNFTFRVHRHLGLVKLRVNSLRWLVRLLPKSQSVLNRAILELFIVILNKLIVDSKVLETFFFHCNRSKFNIKVTFPVFVGDAQIISRGLNCYLSAEQEYVDRFQKPTHRDER